MGSSISRAVSVTLSTVLTLLFVLPSVLTAQDPGVTKPTLEALVANSATVSTVRVQSVTTDDARRNLLQVRFQVIHHLKRPWDMPGEATGSEAKPASESKSRPRGADATGVLVMQAEDLKDLRYYTEAYWSIDLSSPMGLRLPSLLEDWRKRESELLLFQGFRSVGCGPLSMLVDPDRDEVILSDLSTVSSGKVILGKVAELLELYRGMQGFRLILLDVPHFLPAVRREMRDAPAFDARALLLPADAGYEHLLLAQIRHPDYLHDDEYTVSRETWLKYTRNIYHFCSPENAKILRELLEDPQTGQQQRALLQQILAAWEAR